MNSVADMEHEIIDRWTKKRIQIINDDWLSIRDRVESNINDWPEVFASPTSMSYFVRENKYVAKRYLGYYEGARDYAVTLGSLGRYVLSSAMKAEKMAVKARDFYEGIPIPTRDIRFAIFNKQSDVYDEWSLIDIKSAYWTIMSTYPLTSALIVKENEVKLGRQQKVVLANHFGWLQDKNVKLATWGSMVKPNLSRLVYGRMTEAPYGNTHYNNSAVHWLYLVMNAIVCDMRYIFGVRVFNTDCAFVSKSQEAEVISYFKEAWKLDISVKGSGEGIVYGPNHYKVGDKWGNKDHMIRRMESGYKPPLKSGDYYEMSKDLLESVRKVRNHILGDVN